MRKSLNLVILLLLPLLAACRQSPYEWRGSLYDPPNPAPDFALPSTQDDTFRLSDQGARITLIFFGYTFCPDVCPATVGDAAWRLDQLGPQSDQVQFVFITVDPQRDTLDRLSTYLGAVDERLIGLRPDPEGLEDLLYAYGATYVIEPSDDPEMYLITHTARIFLVDQDGLLQANYDFATPRDDLLADLEHLLESDS
jgi:protein SCO1/2